MITQDRWKFPLRRAYAGVTPFVFDGLIPQTCAIVFVWIYSALGRSGDQKSSLVFQEYLGDEFWGDAASILWWGWRSPTVQLPLQWQFWDGHPCRRKGEDFFDLYSRKASVSLATALAVPYCLCHCCIIAALLKPACQFPLPGSDSRLRFSERSDPPQLWFLPLKMVGSVSKIPQLIWTFFFFFFPKPWDPRKKIENWQAPKILMTLSIIVWSWMHVTRTMLIHQYSECLVIHALIRLCLEWVLWVDLARTVSRYCILLDFFLGFDGISKEHQILTDTPA